MGGQVPNYCAPLPLGSGQKLQLGAGEQVPLVSLLSAVPAQPSHSPEIQVQSR